MKARKIKRLAVAQAKYQARAEKIRCHDAKRRWANIGEIKEGKSEQWIVVRELVESRQSELLKAYADLKGIGYGIGSRKEKDKPTPCVVFFVGSKRKHVAPQKALPTHLFSYASLHGERILVAVPTDVKAQKSYRSVVAQSATQIQVSSGSSGEIPGMLASPINIRYSDGALDQRTYVLSCVHVLGMLQEFFPRLGPKCRFRPRGTGRQIGNLSGYFGPVIPGSRGDSFDAALGVIDSDNGARGLLRTILPEVWPQDRIYSRDQIPLKAEILTSRGRIVATRQITWISPAMAIQYRTPTGSIAVVHPGLIEWRASTMSGDSGSPVVSIDHRILLGMLIAGDGVKAMMIPAYELFQAARYGMTAQTSLTIASSI